MQNSYISTLRDFYRSELLSNVVPFWVKNSPDLQFGGFLTCLDRQGKVIDDDKSIWFQGRMTWLFATLYNEVERNETWLNLAKSGASFLENHGFDSDNRMFFHVTREGTAIRKRRYFFSECFAAMGYAALAQSTADPLWSKRAEQLFSQVISYIDNPSLLPQKFTNHRPTRGLAVPMILLVTAQVLRKTISAIQADKYIDKAISEIKKFFVKEEYGVVMETVGLNGEIINHFDGRLLNPGHAIEAAWFIMAEGKHRSDPALIALGTKMLDWMWIRGWDNEYGGMLYFRDIDDLSVQEYWHDMKFWWPHNETIIATLMAWKLTGDEKYLKWHQQVHDWSYKHFPDAEYGEWFGYLHKDGSISSTLKGNMWKGAYHLPRMLLMCWKMLDEEYRPIS